MFHIFKLNILKPHPYHITEYIFYSMIHDQSKSLFTLESPILDIHIQLENFDFKVVIILDQNQYEQTRGQNLKKNLILDFKETCMYEHYCNAICRATMNGELDHYHSGMTVQASVFGSPNYIAY